MFSNIQVFNNPSKIKAENEKCAQKHCLNIYNLSASYLPIFSVAVAEENPRDLTGGGESQYKINVQRPIGKIAHLLESHGVENSLIEKIILKASEITDLHDSKIIKFGFSNYNSLQLVTTFFILFSQISLFNNYTSSGIGFYLAPVASTVISNFFADLFLSLENKNKYLSNANDFLCLCLDKHDCKLSKESKIATETLIDEYLKSKSNGIDKLLNSRLINACGVLLLGLSLNGIDPLSSISAVLLFGIVSTSIYTRKANKNLIELKDKYFKLT